MSSVTTMLLPGVRVVIHCIESNVQLEEINLKKSTRSVAGAVDQRRPIVHIQLLKVYITSVCIANICGLHQRGASFI